MTNPTFSIIIPTHNGADRIGKAIDSCLTQSYENFEIIVVCDSCTDNTADVALAFNDPRIRIIHVDCHRDGLARNAGLDAATGDWILFLDDDDWWLFEFAFHELEKMSRDKLADVINFAIIWRTVGYRFSPSGSMLAMGAGHCWRRSFVGDTRFDDAQYSSDTHFINALIARKPIGLYTGLPLYYYNYMRPGSLSDLHKKGEI